MKINPILFLLFLLTLLSQSCSSDAQEPTPTPGDPEYFTLIEPAGYVEGTEERNTSTSDGTTRGSGPINGTGTALGISLFRADETYAAAYNSGPHAATITAAAKINTGLYYAPSKNTKLIGVYPAVDGTNVVWNSTNRTVTYKAIDGATDILASGLTEGSRASVMSTMAFSHMLTQVKITMVANADAVGKWGTMNSVTINGKKQDIVVTLPAANTSGAASATGSGTASNLAVTTASGGTPTAVVPTATLQTFGYAMFAPVTTAGTLSLTIATADGSFTKTSASQVYAAGMIYEIKLTFTAAEIVLSTVTIGAWGSGGSQNITL